LGAIANKVQGNMNPNGAPLSSEKALIESALLA